MGLGYPSAMWYRIRPALSARYRTIALDNRGAGRSDVPPGPYSIPQMASDAAAVLDAAGVESAHVFGVSMGGMIAQEFVLQYPRRVLSLILGCAAAGGPTAVRAEAEAIQMLRTRNQMSPEQAAEATVPFIYDPATPREWIDEDIAIRRPWFPTPEPGCRDRLFCRAPHLGPQPASSSPPFGGRRRRVNVRRPNGSRG